MSARSFPRQTPFDDARQRAIDAGIPFADALLQALAANPTMSAFAAAEKQAEAWATILADLRRAIFEVTMISRGGWLRTFTEALTAWDSDQGKALMGRCPFSGTERALFEEGLAAVAEDNPVGALSMLQRLINQPDLGKEDAALLLILAARAHMARAAADDFEMARNLLALAKKRAADLPLIDVAAADLARLEGAFDTARAAYQKAAAQTPTLDTAHAVSGALVGLGLLAEREEQWGEADKYFDAAIAALQRAGVGDFLNTFRAYFAPRSGNLYLQAGYTLQRMQPDLALKAADEAIALGMKAPTSLPYPEKIAHQLRGDLLRGLNRVEEAAEAYRETAQRHQWSYQTTNNADDLRESGAAYEAAINLLSPPPDGDARRAWWERWQGLYWSGSDTYLIASYLNRPPYVDGSMLERSIDLYHRGMSFGGQSAEYNWTYTLRARQLGQQAQLEPPPRPKGELIWESHLTLERGWQKNREDAYFWIALAQSFAALWLDTNAVDTVRRALALLPQDRYVVGEAIIIFVNAGEYAAARELIPRRLELEETPEIEDWCDAITAFIMLHEGKAEEALALMNAVLAGKDYVWARAGLGWAVEIKTTALAALERWEDFHAYVLESVAKAEDAERHGEGDERRCAYLRMIANGYEAVLPFYRDEIAISEREAAANEFNMAMCYAALGDLTRADRFVRAALASATNTRVLADYIGADLKIIAHYTADKPYADDLKRLIAVWQQIGLERLADLQQYPIEPLNELEGALTSPALTRRARVALQSGVARLRTFAAEDGAASWQEVVLTYEDMPLNDDPDLRECAENAAVARTAFLVEVDRHIRIGRSDEALLALRTLHNLHPPPTGELSLRLAERHAFLAFLREGDTPLVRERFGEALNAHLGTQMVSLLPDAETYWELDSLLAALKESSSADKQTLWAAAQTQLSAFLNVHFGLVAPQPAPIPAVYTPIYLELDEGLITDATRRGEGAVFETYLPALRERLMATYGVRPPGIRLRETGAETRYGYRILLDEILVEVGTADESLPDPITAAMEALGRILEGHLPSFAFLDDLALYILPAWQTQPGVPDLITRLLPDTAAKLRLSEVLRGLLAERRPVLEGKPILEALAHPELDTVAKVIAFLDGRESN